MWFFWVHLLPSHSSSRLVFEGSSSSIWLKFICEAYERRPSRQLQCMERSISETNGRAAGSIPCKPSGKLFPVIITPFVMCFYPSHLSHPGEIFNRVTRTLPVRKRGSRFSKMRNCCSSCRGFCVDRGWRNIFCRKVNHLPSWCRNVLYWRTFRILY